MTTALQNVGRDAPQAGFGASPGKRGVPFRAGAARKTFSRFAPLELCSKRKDVRWFDDQTAHVWRKHTLPPAPTAPNVHTFTDRVAKNMLLVPPPPPTNDLVMQQYWYRTWVFISLHSLPRKNAVTISEPHPCVAQEVKKKKSAVPLLVTTRTGVGTSRPLCIEENSSCSTVKSTVINGPTMRAGFFSSCVPVVRD